MVHLRLPVRMPARSDRNKRILRLLAAGQLLLGLLLGLGLFDRVLMPLVVHHGANATVPDMRGKSRDKVEALLTESHLRLGRVVEVPDRATKIGDVLTQDPPAGAVVRRGRLVHLLVSGGAPVHNVPDFTGRTVRSARLDLARLGLRQGAILILPSETLPEGQIVGTHPGRGALARQDGTIDFLVSGGMRRSAYLMPDLRGLPMEEAGAKLRAAGIEAASTPEAEGDIVSNQSPAPGDMVSTGDRVLLE